MSQTDFQRRAFTIAQQAHSSADRADARILMRMVEVVDEGDLAGLDQLAQALQAKYRRQLGRVPGSGESATGEDQSGA